MLYKSTRNTTVKKTFCEILLEGLAPDGGLYVPDRYPKISKEQLQAWSSLSYPELAFEVCSLFIGDDIPSDDLKAIINKTYTQDAFGTAEIVPIRHLVDDIHVMALSNGPSLAFKDMAMQLLGNLMSYELDRRGETLLIVGASSGDTVSAAEEAMRGKANIKVLMLTPKHGMSPFQKAQAGSILDDNIYNLSIEGRFDDCQDLVKEINKDAAFKAKHTIGAVNSINWGRIMAQTVYHIQAYLTSGAPQIDIAVPSGNFGNVLAAHVAKEMGVPIRTLIVATNENVVLDQFFKTGIYEQHDVQVTSAPSMDISKASNLERFLFDLLGRGDTQLTAIMEEFESKKKIDLSAFLNDIKTRYGFISESSTHQERARVIKTIYEKCQDIIDPHTAASVKVALDCAKNDGVPIICMETAKPSKFESAVEEAIGFVPDRPAGFQDLESREQRFYDCGSSVDDLKRFIESHVR